MNLATSLLADAYSGANPLIQAMNDGTFGSLILAILIPALIILVIVLAGLWMVFKKAGQPGWAALIPVYSTIVLLRIVGMDWWWVLVIIFGGVIPIIGGLISLVVSVYLVYRLALCFGKGAGFTVGLVILPFIFYPILGFDSSEYMEPTAEPDLPTPPPAPTA